ncbi:hypothetical protein [Klebsiella quasivariicola]|uniref:hypothetical protein n=1 Tax=Klebsiella quasivariicola TaxID=2026240 RepID=UPI002B05E88F|nr:hypothetical protein [Klebsiella quasivariicola]
MKVGQVLSLADIENVKMLCRMALAAMDSEPVKRVNADQMHHVCLEANRHLDKYGAMAKEVNKLLGRIPAHPAPVVPEEATPDSIEILASARRRDHAVFQWDEDQRNAAADSWNACRAAMLQELQKSAGAEATCRSNENVQAVEVQSLTSINPAPDLVSLQKKAESIIGNYPGIPDGYVMVPKEPTEEMLAAAKEWTGLTSTAEVVYVKMLAAAPQEALVVPEKIEQSRKKIDRCDVCTEGARGGCGTCIFNGNFG